MEGKEELIEDCGIEELYGGKFAPQLGVPYTKKEKHDIIIRTIHSLAGEAGIVKLTEDDAHALIEEFARKYGERLASKFYYELDLREVGPLIKKAVKTHEGRT